MDSPPPPSVGSTLPTSLCSVCNILHYLSVCITAVSAGGERLGESFFQKTKGGRGLSVLRVIYILWSRPTGTLRRDFLTLRSCV